jgi:hypothetical protein
LAASDGDYLDGSFYDLGGEPGDREHVTMRGGVTLDAPGSVTLFCRGRDSAADGTIMAIKVGALEVQPFN